MVISHNLAAMNTSNKLNSTTKKLQKSTEKLSSGYKINRAADDAAGLTISEKMRWQIRGLNRAASNIQDGESYCNVAEGALQEVHSMLDRIKELSVQAANDTNTDSDREALDKEVQQLVEEMNKTFKETMFNTQKIWAGSYIPEVSGQPTDFSFYRASDASGTYIGGIEYLNHRYSWEDLGIGYDRATQKFTETGSKKIDLTILKDDVSTAIDDNASSVNSFELKYTKGKSLDTLEKTYDWSATNEGIRIDGVLAKGSKGDEEGNTTWAAMGLTQGQHVNAGTYSFEYYGMQVSFDVPEGGADWDEFLDSINNPKVKIDWHSERAGVVNNESFDVTKLNTSKVTVNTANKDMISTTGYSVYADTDKVAVTYDNGNVKPVEWNTMPGSGSFRGQTESATVSSWGNVGDSSANFSINNNLTYVFDDRADGGFISFDFKLDETGSSESIITDISGTKINVKTYSPTDVSVTNTGSDVAGKTSVWGMSTVGFNTQRDDFGRAFASDTENIGTGTIGTSDDGIYQIDFGTGRTIFTAGKGVDIKAELARSLKNGYKWLIGSKKPDADGNIKISDTESLRASSCTYTFTNNEFGENNSITLKYNLSAITYGDIKDDTSDERFVELAQQIIDANATVELNGDGETYQNMSYSETSVSEPQTVSTVAIDGYDISLNIQSGAIKGQNIAITYDYLRASSLGLGGISLLTGDSAQMAISQADVAIDRISEQRSLFGAYVNRLEHAYDVNKINVENTQSAESRLRDTDMADEMVEYSKHNILSQMGQSMLTQANQQTSQVLSLLS